GGIGGPKGPGSIGTTEDVGDIGDVASGVESGTAADRVGPSELDALASDLATGKLTPREAIDHLVARAGAGLPAPAQAGPREMITDLVADDPYPASPANRPRTARELPSLAPRGPRPP